MQTKVGRDPVTGNDDDAAAGESENGQPNRGESPISAPPERFNAAYYERYYLTPATQVMPAGIVGRLADFLLSYIRYLEIEVRHILEFGPGTGIMQDALRKRLPKAGYTGVELSHFACAQYGWIHGSVADWTPPRSGPNLRADLTICYDVLQYLCDADAMAALKNLRAQSPELLFFSAMTEADMLQNCEPQLTDSEVFLRTADWYREPLRQTHRNLGGGLWLNRASDIVVFELEYLE